MEAKEYMHVLTALGLGLALGALQAPPLLGYLAALLAALALRRMGFLRQAKGALEYAGVLALSWSIAATALHP